MKFPSIPRPSGSDILAVMRTLALNYILPIMMISIIINLIRFPAEVAVLLAIGVIMSQSTRLMRKRRLRGPLVMAGFALSFMMMSIGFIFSYTYTSAVSLSQEEFTMVYSEVLSMFEFMIIIGTGCAMLVMIIAEGLPSRGTGQSIREEIMYYSPEYWAKRHQLVENYRSRRSASRWWLKRRHGADDLSPTSANN